MHSSDSESRVFLDNDGVRLALDVIGAGPNLLFVHGLGSAIELWDDYVGELAADYRCWRLDLRGHGDSARAPTYRQADYASDVACALDYIASPTAGVGHSLGGRSLAHVAVRGHEYLAAAYLIDSPLTHPADGATPMSAVFGRILEVVQRFQAEERPVDDYAAWLGDMPYPVGGTNRDHFLPQRLRGRADALSRLDPATIEATMAGYISDEPVEPAIPIPVCLAAADPEFGGLISYEVEAPLRELTPHIEIERFLGVGHQMLMVREFAQAILDHLRDFIGRHAVLGELSDEEAKAILQAEARRTATLWRALDLDGDGVLSASEIDQAPSSLLALDTTGDGQLTVDEIGGPFRWPGGERRSTIVRILDLDGDGVITAQDIADAPNRLRRLDRLGRGHLLPTDDRPVWNPILARAHSGPAETLAHFDTLRNYADQLTGDVLPGADDRQDDGYLLIYEHCNAGDVQVGRDLFLLSTAGERVHDWPALNHASETVSAHLRDDGLLVRTSCPSLWLDVLCFPVGAHGIISIEEPDGTVVWEYRLFEPGERVLHHSFECMPNGNILVTVYEGKTFDEAVEFGWQRQSQDVLMRPPDLQRWWTETILELEPNLETGETSIVWEWHSADHLVQDVDPALPHFGAIGPGCRKIDINYALYPSYRFNMGQVMHVNTVSYDAELDVVMLSSAMHGELWIVDHSTTTEEARGERGDLLYRFGNTSSHKGGPDSDKVLDWQHDIHWLPEDVPRAGHVLIFNNGSRRPGDDSPNPSPERLSFLNDGYSEIVEIKLPVDHEGAWHWDLDDPLNGAEIVWEYNADGSADWFSPFMSGARRRPNGNTVTALGFNKRIREVTPDGETVLDFLPGGPGRTFRVTPIAADHPGLRRVLS